MKPRSDTANGQLEVQAVYSIPVLARVAGVTPQLLTRLLRANDVQLVTSGRALLVPLSEIERRIPPLWKSIQMIERLRADVARGTIVPPETR